MVSKTTKKPKLEENYNIFNPKNAKQTIEIAVKPKPSYEELVTVEKVGKIRKSSPRKKPEISNNIVLDPKGYILIITEKPQAAAKIASALSDGMEKKVSSTGGVSYYDFKRNGKKVIVACAVGHLFTVSQKEKGTSYPIFEIDWFPNFKVKKKDFTKKYYAVIEKLVKSASEVVVATDFDIEGEVIGYNIVRFIAKQPDAKRMKFSSLTTDELIEAYETRHPSIEWGSAIAGETRHFVDWLYGINLSRALMNSIKTTGKFRIMSIGRVQGPALNLIVEKEKEIRKFISTPYWQIFAKITDNKNETELKHNKDITKKQELAKFHELAGKTAIAETSKTKQIIPPPAPFDLTTLQTEGYKNHGITPSQVLQIAQKLYLAGLISYPRTSSQKIPDNAKPLEVLKKLSRNFPDYTRHITKQKPVEGKKSDPAHPSIMPTGLFEKLEGQEKKIYDLIVKRFISCFCDESILENKKITMEINKLKFEEKGLEIIKKAWMEVYPAKMQEKEIKDFNGEVLIKSIRDEEKMTKPPNRYSPASIVTELEKRNLGTKATRANIIETLYDRNYIKERSIEATELGIKLIDSLKKYSPVIIDEKLTREIEHDMDSIREMKKDLEPKKQIVLKKAHEALVKISNDFKQNESKIGIALLEANQLHWDKQKEDNILEKECPECIVGKLQIKYSPRFKSFFIGCTKYPDCSKTFSLPSGSLIKKAEKTCAECSYPMLISIKKAKRPWVFCFNPDCITRKNKTSAVSESKENDSEDESIDSDE